MINSKFIVKSLIIPVYKNESNIRALIDAINIIAKNYNDFEVIFVVDGSPDNSYKLLTESKKFFNCQLIDLSRNFGSFAAIRCGMANARGKYIAVMAADLQEPIELIIQFFSALEFGNVDVVFGQRIGRKDSITQNILANLFWSLYKKFINSDMPKGGVDIFGCNDKVKKAVLSIEESNSSLVAHLFWVGYRRLFVPYQRLKREQGTSAWSLSKRFKYFLDSVFSFTDYPILIILWIGILGTTISLIFGVTTLFAKLMGYIDVSGYTTIVILGSIIGSMILVTQGILGCYLWRAFENTKKRPLCIIDTKEIFDKD